MKNQILRVNRYFKVGILLHSISLIFFTGFIYLLLDNKSLMNGNFLNDLFILWLTCFILSVSVLAELDVYSRFQNYKQVKDQIYEFGFQNRILVPMMKSKCQRDALKLACMDLNLKSDIIELFESNGYKWFNIFPDFVLKNPQFVFNKLFWRTTFFVSYYSSKNFKY